MYYKTFLTRLGISKMVSAAGTLAACNAATLPCAVPISRSRLILHMGGETRKELFELSKAITFHRQSKPPFF